MMMIKFNNHVNCGLEPKRFKRTRMIWLMTVSKELNHGNRTSSTADSQRG